MGRGLPILGGPSSPSLPGADAHRRHGWVGMALAGVFRPGGRREEGRTGRGLGWATLLGSIPWPFSLLGVIRREHDPFQGSEMEQGTSSQLHTKP